MSRTEARVESIPAVKGGPASEIKERQGRVMYLPEGINPKPVGEELASGAGRNELCKQVPRQLSAARLLLQRASEEGREGKSQANTAGGHSCHQELLDGVARAPV